MINTLNYSEMTQSFMSFVSSKPKWYFDFKNKHYSFDDNGDFLLHNSNDMCNKLSNTPYPDRSFIRLLVNESYSATKVFDNVSFAGDNINLMTSYHKFYTTSQESSEVTSLLIDKREDTYKFAIPRNTKSGAFTTITQLDPVLIGTTKSELGTGMQNTIDIIDKLGDRALAANICYNSVSGGYSDWFLPSIGDINSFFSNRDSLNMQQSIYLTSTEKDINNVYTSTGWVNKNGTNQTHVRAIRYFSSPLGTSYSIGQQIQGGYIAYILNTLDPGYKDTSVNGIVVATSDQTINTAWSMTTIATETLISPGGFADRMRGKYLVCDYSFQNNEGKMFTLPFIETIYRYSMI